MYVRRFGVVLGVRVTCINIGSEEKIPTDSFMEQHSILITCVDCGRGWRGPTTPAPRRARVGRKQTLETANTEKAALANARTRPSRVQPSTPTKPCPYAGPWSARVRYALRAEIDTLRRPSEPACMHVPRISRQVDHGRCSVDPECSSPLIIIRHGTGILTNERIVGDPSHS